MKRYLRIGLAGVCMALLAGPAVHAQQKPARTNTMIAALEQTPIKPLVSDDLYYFYDMEHPPFNVAGFGDALDSGKLPKGKPVITRITAYGWELEKNLWQVKQVLDSGANGVIFPRIETPEQAVAAIRAMRYPQRPGSKDYEPTGLRGWLPTIAAKRWGVDGDTYMEKADIWGMDPSGELIAILLIESKPGVERVRDILKAMKDINAKVVVWAGTGDLSMDYCGVGNCEIKGKPTPEAGIFEQGVRKILAAGKEFGMPVQMNSAVVHDPQTGARVEQGMAAHIKQRMEQGARMFPNLTK